MGLFGSIPHDAFLDTFRPRVPSDVHVGVSHMGEDGIQIVLQHTPAAPKKKSYIGSVNLRWMSGTVVASTDLFIAEKHRRKGYSGVFEVLKVAACKQVGATMLIATVKHDNAAEIGAIQKHGWQRMAKLGDEDLWGKILNDTPTYLTVLERRK